VPAFALTEARRGKPAADAADAGAPPPGAGGGAAAPPPPPARAGAAAARRSTGGGGGGGAGSPAGAARPGGVGAGASAGAGGGAPPPPPAAAAPAARRAPAGGAGGISASRAAELAAQVDDLRLSVESLEKERDFYFAKLRDVEVLLQTTAPAGAEAKALADAVFAILYATDNAEFVPVDPATGQPIA